MARHDSLLTKIYYFNESIIKELVLVFMFTLVKRALFRLTQGFRIFGPATVHFR